MRTLRRVLLEAHELEKIPVDPDEVYYLEAEREQTLVRFRGARRFRDRRALGDLLPLFAPHGFVRIHRNHAVNLVHVRLIRRRKGVDDWEVPAELAERVLEEVLRDHSRDITIAMIPDAGHVLRRRVGIGPLERWEWPAEYWSALDAWLERVLQPRGQR